VDELEWQGPTEMFTEIAAQFDAAAKRGRPLMESATSSRRKR